METLPENRLTNPEFAEQARESVAFYIEELLTEPGDRLNPSEYALSLPDLIRAGEKVFAPASLAVALQKCQEELKLTNKEYLVLKEMITKKPDYSIYPKLPSRPKEGSRLDDEKLISDVLDYLTKRFNERIDTCESEWDRQDYEKYRNLNEQVQQGKDLSMLLSNVQLRGFIIACLQDIRLTPDEIDQIKAILEGKK